MKNCPFCAEEIQDAAIKCRYCGEMLPEVHPAPETSLQEEAAPASVSTKEVVRSSRPFLDKKIQKWLMASLLLAVVLMAITGVVVKRHNDRLQLEHQQAVKEAQTRARLQSIDSKAAAAFEAYQKDALETLDEISKLTAATETGINIVRYSELLGQVNYRVMKFKEAYQNKIESRFPSYLKTVDAMAAYVEASTAWQEKNDAEYGKYKYEETLQAAWSRAGESIQQARSALKSPQGAENWREPSNFRDYIRQVSGSDEEAQFAAAHQQKANEHFLQEALECESNQKALRTAIEIWSRDHGGRYPTRLSELSPQYIKQVSGCPKNGEYVFESTELGGPPDLFTLLCSGTHPAVPQEQTPSTATPQPKDQVSP